MLPPVSTASSSYLAYQETRAPGDTAGSGANPGANTGAQTPRALEQNNAIAGRLNLLLLSGQERMSQNLAVLVDVLGNALKMERLPEEALSAYAARLVEALGDLSTRERISLQRQLLQAFAGLQLRTLIEAFRNPAGPEAATLSMYLELYRQKDRDLAARSVVTSYRQNAGEGRTPSASTSAAGGVAPLPSVAPLTIPDGEAALLPKIVAAAGERLEQPSAGARMSPSTISSAVVPGTLHGDRQEAVAPMQARQPPSAPDIPPAGNRIVVTEGDPRTLQIQLNEVFSDEGRVSAQAQRRNVVSAEAIGTNVSGSPASAPIDDETSPQARTGILDPASFTQGDEPGSEPPEQGGESDRVSVAAMVAAGVGSLPAKNVPGSEAFLIETVETDLVRALLNLQVEEIVEKDRMTADAVESGEEEPTLQKSHLSLTMSSSENDVTSALAPRVRNGGFEEQVVYAMSVPLDDAQVVANQSGLREAIPIPYVNYLIADEFTLEPAEAEERSSSDAEEDEAGEGEDQSEEGEAADDQPEEHAEQTEAEGSMLGMSPDDQGEPLALEDFRSDPLVVESRLDDPAHDLYLRMSGLI